jgi:riboflavin biosynthesis pyrimidine reductase
MGASVHPDERGDALTPIEVLFEAPGLPAFDLPHDLTRLYGGSFGVPTPSLFANFVSSVDGVVALPGRAHSSTVIAAASAADRFVMGLLRASADAVLVGAGTVRAAPGALWTPGFICPPAAAAYGDLRRRRGMDPGPRLSVVTASGDLDPAHPALDAGTTIFTTRAGGERLRSRLRRSCRVAVVDGERFPVRAVVERMSADGDRRILTEGGPTLVGELLGSGLLDELFLTLAPTLAGRDGAEHRPGLVERLAFPPERIADASLLGVRRHGSHLFLRYRLASRAGVAGVPAP